MLHCSHGFYDELARDVLLGTGGWGGDGSMSLTIRLYRFGTLCVDEVVRGCTGVMLF